MHQTLPRYLVGMGEHHIPPSCTPILHILIVEVRGFDHFFPKSAKSLHKDVEHQPQNLRLREKRVKAGVDHLKHMI